jgi:RNA polymerase sigma-70 factor (ECF subfamily)
MGSDAPSPQGRNGRAGPAIGPSPGLARHTPPAPDETRLLERLRANDDAAYEELVRTHAGPLLAVSRRFLNSEEDAQDAVQNAFIAAFRSLDRFAGESRLSTWLHRIVINTSLMALRTRKRRPEESLDALLPRFTEQGVIVGPVREWKGTPEAVLQRQEARLKVREAIRRLPDLHRTVILLRDIEELDTAETARLLKITPNAVKIRLHRARQALRTLLETGLNAWMP